MKNFSNFNFEVSYSDSNYNAKPTKKQIKHMHFIHCKTNVNEFVDKISKGYAYCSVYNNDEFGISLKKDSNFAYTQVISVDIDKTTISLNEALKTLKTTPTMAYNTFSNGVNDKYCYRLVYIFENPIVSINDAKLYTLSLNKIVSDELNIKTDSKASKVSQYFNGTNDSNIFTSNFIYELNDFKLDNNFNTNYNTNNNLNNIKVQSKYIEERTQQYDLTCTFENDTTLINNINKNINNNKSAIQKQEEETQQYDLSCTFEKNTTFEKDYWNNKMSFSKLCEKYDSIMPNIQNTELDIPSEDEPFINIPSDYREIKRYWYLTVDDKDRKTDCIKKIGDGMGRRHKLFINGVIRRLINPQITFDNLLHNLVWEFITYMYNNGNHITKVDIWNIAKNVMNTDLSRYSTLGTTSRKWKVNPYFALKHNMSKREVINKYKNNKKQYIGEFYDASLTDKENVKVMKEYGFEISLRTLKTWRKENNITKYKKQYEKESNKKNIKFDSKPSNGSTLITIPKDEENPIQGKEMASTSIVEDIDASRTVEGRFQIYLDSVESLKKMGIAITRNDILFQKYCIIESCKKEDYGEAVIQGLEAKIDKYIKEYCEKSDYKPSNEQSGIVAHQDDLKPIEAQQMPSTSISDSYANAQKEIEDSNEGDFASEPIPIQGMAVA